ncbi:polysaccharide biosynthesis tyrosine autokinase [Nakamurella endophytica]|uniref:non-specific protein-tyrosine kinase n=1 Tax=Nakamurella endophytica TaxID=1748367 RepID=A0A917WBL0_9ACTN|nr:polysaccharide biosynthesis tyrosine autokinase [Nakamurella endophytica]GGL87342.1 chromosome partitioning protein [Nakamurella endophytica]
MDFRWYVRAIRKSWWVVALCTLLGVGGAIGLNETATRLYASSVTFYVSTPTDAAGGNAYQANLYALARIATYTKLLKSQELAELVVEDAGLDIPATKVASEITPSSDAETVIFTATVIDTSPQRSLAIATSVAKEFGPLVDRLDNRRSSTGPSGATVALNVTSDPTLNPVPVSPRTSRNLMLGIGSGLVLGILLALLRALLDTSIRSLATLREVTGLPALGTLYYDASAKRTPILVGPAVRSVRAEAFRQLRTNLQFVDVDNPVHVLVVTSSLPNEGKSTTAANLAILYAETGRRVLLIEGDMRKGRVAEYLGLERAVGLSDVLAGNADVRDVLQTWNADGLTVLLGGSVPPNPSELLGSHNMAMLLGQLRGMFDVIVIDTPPLLPVTDAAVAATLADGVLLVVRQGRTSRTQVAASVRSLQAVDARILGAVLSMVRKRSDDTKAYGYYAEATKGPEEPPGPTTAVASSTLDGGRRSGAEPPVLVRSLLRRHRRQLG